jgi:hypothetical protein
MFAPFCRLPFQQESQRKQAKLAEARDAAVKDQKKRKYAAMGKKDKRRKLNGGGSMGGGPDDD